MVVIAVDLNPFALSLSKGSPSYLCKKGKGFDKLSPNGFGLDSRHV